MRTSQQNKDNILPRSVNVISVIEIVTAVGEGTEDAPNRLLTTYWSMDGKFLAYMDPITE